MEVTGNGIGEVLDGTSFMFAGTFGDCISHSAWLNHILAGWIKRRGIPVAPDSTLVHSGYFPSAERYSSPKQSLNERLTKSWALDP